MCTNSREFQCPEDSKDYSLEKIIQRARTHQEAWRASGENINFTGGEPTIHPSFLHLLYWFRKSFPENRLVLATNGRMLSYESFVKDLLKVKNLVAEIAVLGKDKNQHDRITGVENSFSQTTKGIENFLKYRDRSQELELRVIIIKQNYKSLDDIIDFISGRFSSAERLVLIFPEPEGVCGENFSQVGVTYKEVREKVESVAGEANRKFSDFRLYHFPLCTLDSRLWKLTWITQRREEVSFLDSCDQCLYKDYCCGIHKDYLDIVGGKEFQPIQDKIALKIDDKNPHHPILGKAGNHA